MQNAIYNSVVYDALAVPSDLSHVVESTCDPANSHGSGLKGCVNQYRQTRISSVLDFLTRCRLLVI